MLHSVTCVLCPLESSNCARYHEEFGSRTSNRLRAGLRKPAISAASSCLSIASFTWAKAMWTERKTMLTNSNIFRTSFFCHGRHQHVFIYESPKVVFSKSLKKNFQISLNILFNEETEQNPFEEVCNITSKLLLLHAKVQHVRGVKIYSILQPAKERKW